MPPAAVVVIRLEDSSLADAPAKVLAEEQITLGNRQVPVPFSLNYDPAKIEEQHTYAVRASIFVDGQLRFTSDKVYPVLTRGNGTRADLLLKPVPSPTSPQP